MADSKLFVYQAQTRTGQAIRGTLEAASNEQARMRLLELGAIVLSLDESPGPPLKSSRPLGSDDFMLFNQQLAHLTAAGLPVEQGLRLIAADVRSGRLARAATEVAEDLERGVPLEQAFGQRESRFPPLYSKVVQAGVRAGNLPGLLFNLGRHLELVARLRQLLWRTLAYPVAVLIALALVVTLIAVKVLPQFREIFKDFKTTLPALTEFVLWFGDYIGPIALSAGVVLLAVVGVVVLLRALRLSGQVRDWLLLPLPLVGAIIRRSLLARWCDALRLGIEAGVDLPQAIALAGEAVGSPRLMREGQDFAQMLSRGEPPGNWAVGRLIPPTVPAAIELGSSAGDLPATLATLTQMYEQQADYRLRLLPTIITPLFVFGLGLVIGTIVIAMFLPLVKLIQSVSGS